MISYNNILKILFITGKDSVLGMIRKRKDVKQRQDRVQVGAHGEHGQNAPPHVAVAARHESVSVSHKYQG